FKEARRLKIPLIPRAEALAEMMRLRRGIAVGGSHGKTTTTSLTASIFIHAKSQPTIVVGGRLDLIKSTALLGQGEWLIAEADESDGSFSRLSPEIVVVTNIDNDHLDYYGTVEYLKKAFFDFAMRIPFYGLAIVCGDDAATYETFKEFGKRIVFYGFEKHNDLRLEGSKGEYDVYRAGDKIGSISLGMPGKHNALNAAAALAAGLEAGFPFAVCAEGLTNFQGVDRRFQHKGVKNGVDVYDDYGHHPTEVQAVLNAFKEKFPDRRLVTVFQPHRYSRTHLCWDQFVNCFADAGDLFVCEIYAAGEDPIANVSSDRMVREIKTNGHSPRTASLMPAAPDRLAKIDSILKPGDILLTLGAGDIWKLGMQYLEVK
ncbi:MAG: UDP-N-acetylmuramate--L-alanine ligase, partial [Bdellovibrionota bacterium]